MSMVSLSISSPLVLSLAPSIALLEFFLSWILSGPAYGTSYWFGMHRDIVYTFLCPNATSSWQTSHSLKALHFSCSSFMPLFAPPSSSTLIIVTEEVLSVSTSHFSVGIVITAPSHLWPFPCTCKFDFAFISSLTWHLPYDVPDDLNLPTALWMGTYTLWCVASYLLLCPIIAWSPTFCTFAFIFLPQTYVTTNLGVEGHYEFGNPSFVDRGTWELVSYDIDANILTCKWVYPQV